MDWIEQLFGLSPDGGNGLTEALFALAIVGGLVLTVSVVRLSRRNRAR